MNSFRFKFKTNNEKNKEVNNSKIISVLNHENKNKSGKIAFAQIFILFVSVIAIAWMLGSEVRLVSGLKEKTINAIDPDTNEPFNANAYILEKGDNPSELITKLKTKDVNVWKTGSTYWFYDSDSKKFMATGFMNQRPVVYQTITADESQIKSYMDKAASGWHPNYAPGEEISPKEVGGLSPLPTSASHGTAGRIYEWFAGPGSTAPKGTYTEVLPNGEVIGSKISGAGFSISGIIQGAVYAVMVYGFVRMAGGLFLSKEKANALAKASAWGFFAGKGIYSLIGKGGFLSDKVGFMHFRESGWWTAKSFSIYSGIVIGAIIFLSMYKKEKTKTITFTCDVWEPPEGGQNCEKCNQQGILPCSEYQCRSLGAGCKLINKGTEDEKCVWVNRRDTEPPVIQPWLDALTDGYQYSPDNAISPPDRGVKITPVSGGNCIKAFTPVEFGITTNEPAQCKIDYTRKNNYDEMQFYFGGSSLYKYNHTQVMSLPGPSNLEAENLTIQNNGNYNLYVRCKDSNGNSNIANFVFKYCVEPGPDTTPPVIVTTDLLNNMPVAFNQSEVNIRVYTNEPADCRWSHLDKSYDEMENNMQCSSSVLDMNAQMLYECRTTLNGIKDRQENKFYFRCRDQPGKPDSERNTNQESYVFTIIGTQPLVITSVSPNNTVIKDSTETVKVELKAETSAGYKEGNASCYYSTEDKDSSYIKFYETDSYTHKQELWLPEGYYQYWIKCIDLGGNSDKKSISFDVEVDNQAPLIARVFKEDNYLKLVTTEKAECVYDTQNCNYVFEEGNQFVSSGENKTEHYTEWNTEVNYYVKCKDDYGNQPAPNQCSIIIRPVKIKG